MTSTLKSLVVRSLLVAGFVLGAAQGCGSSGSSSTPSCNDICIKTEMCSADASTATATSNCNLVCGAQGTAGTGGQGTTCTNQSARDSAFNSCFSMSDCTKFNACIAQVPACQTGGGGGSNGAAGKSGGGGATGSAGKSGAAGATGAGGAGSGASCALCDKAVSCCATLGQPASTCNLIPSTAACNAATGTTQSGDISACQQIVSGAGALCP
jgi:hypothetical protein